MITTNGRPSRIGNLYFENIEGGGRMRKYFVSYCPSCKKKIGLTSEELEKFSENLPGKAMSFIARLANLRIILP